MYRHHRDRNKLEEKCIFQSFLSTFFGCSIICFHNWDNLVDLINLIIRLYRKKKN